QERVGMSLAEFIAEFERQPFEIINGERIVKMPGVAGHSYRMYLLYQRLLTFALVHGLGEVLIETTFILPGTYDSNWVKGSRVPDILFFRADRLAAYRAQLPDWENRPYELIPDFVIEVVSPNDSYSDIDAKVDLYLADGVRMIWICDPQRRKVRVHTPIGEKTLTGESRLNGGDVLPGFEIGLTEIFAAPPA
ncbi:MAG: Uma2 family endonuclease, partial [Chitinophagaceae bacterium]|nr:Uma2 family endonuclease [Anaerolineae bacterium]